jgi:hypothetical protein
MKLNNTIMELKRMVQTLAQQYESIHQECKANSTNQGRRLVTCGDSIAKRTIPNVIQQPVHSTTVAPTVITTKASADIVATESSTDATTTKAPRPTKQDTRQDKLSVGNLSAHVSIVFVWMQLVILYMMVL